MRSIQPAATIKALAWFLAGLVLFLTIGIVHSVTRQHALLLKEADAAIEREIGMLQEILRDDFLIRDYARINRLFAAFVNQHEGIRKIRAMAPDGSILGEHGDGAAAHEKHVHSHRISLDAGKYVTLEVVEDLGPIRKSSSESTRRYIVTSILFVISMGGFLLYLLQKTALNPLERSLEEKRKMTEMLERHVRERAVQLTEANSELAQEIAERKRADAALAESEKFLQIVIETEPECVKLLAADGTIMMMNRAGLDMIEADSFDEGQCVYPLVLPEYREEFKKITEEVFQGRSRKFVFQIEGMKGGRLWLDTHAVPLRKDGEIIAMLAITRNITDRKLAEELLKAALKRAEEERIKSEAILAAIGDGISIQNIDFEVLYQNQIHKNIIGDHIGEYCYEAYEHRKEVCPGCPIALSLQDGKIHTAERSARTERGVVYAEITTSPLRDSSGKIIAGIEAVRDITHRKKTEEEKRRNYDIQTAINSLLQIALKDLSLDEILKKALERILSISWLSLESKGAIFLTKDDGTTLAMKAQEGLDPYVRKACAEVHAGFCLCGRAALSQQIQFADAVDERHDIHHNDIKPHGHYCVPIMISRKTLGVIALYLKEAHPRDQQEEEFLKAVANALAGIIQRKRVEDERENILSKLEDLFDKITNSHREWQNTFDSITDPLVILDGSGIIFKANKAFAARFGLSPREVIDKNFSSFFSDFSISIPDQEFAAKTGERMPLTSEFIDPVNGKIFLVSIFPYSYRGEVSSSIIVMKDITLEREKEMRLIMSERLASLGQMASGIAHEINNPLAAIAGCAEGLLNRVNQGRYDAALFENYLKIIEEEIGRCKKITTGMLSFVRQGAAEQKTVDVHELLDKTLELISFQGRLKKIDVLKNYQSGSSVTLGSEGELKQVFLSIITNAIDAMNDMGTLTIRTGIEADSLFVAVSDSGPGIPPEYMHRIFDPFFTTKSDKGGTGLGLSIAKKIVTGHDGDITLSSKKGQGSTFTVTLPLK